LGILSRAEERNPPWSISYTTDRTRFIRFPAWRETLRLC